MPKYYYHPILGFQWFGSEPLFYEKPASNKKANRYNSHYKTKL